MVDGLREEFARTIDRPLTDVRLVRAPYRFCPMGAHLDHQDGPVTGVAFDRALSLAFVPTDDGRVRLRSTSESTDVSFSLDSVPERPAGNWGDYARGAARALAGRIHVGIEGLVEGEMASGGVSTSAALGVACLLALQSANYLELTERETVDLDQSIENDYLGLRNGILDPSIILLAKRNELVHLDCRSRDVSWVPWGGAGDPPAFVAVHSGIASALVDTGYNARVEECTRAAATLLTRDGRSVPETPRLRDVSVDAFAAHRNALPDAERKRATHYFTEVDRVGRGTDAWRRGDARALGEIVTETGESSIRNYECGAPELIDLFQRLVAQPEVLGARFSGAGFRGYAVALVAAEDAADVAASVVADYRSAHPNLADAVHAHVCRSADGARMT